MMKVQGFQAEKFVLERLIAEIKISYKSID